jgi:hypothetical protein
VPAAAVRPSSFEFFQVALSNGLSIGHGEIRMPRKKPVEDDGKPEFKQMPLYQITPEGWVELEWNRQNLVDAGLWFSMKVAFEPQNDHRLRAFVKSSCYGALDEVQMMDRLLLFDIDAISRCLRLPQEGMSISSVAQYTDEDIDDVFDPEAWTSSRYLLSKAKGVWRIWLAYINYRIMFPESKDHISVEGVGAALMAWNGMPLSCSKIIYNNIKLELLRKKPRGVLSLYSAIYLTKLMDPTQPAVPSPPTVNSTVLTYTEIGSTSQEPAAKKRKEFRSPEIQDFAVRMRTQNPSTGPSTFTLDQLASQEVIVLGDMIEETSSAVQNAVHQKSGECISKESAIYRAMELSACQIEKLTARRKTMEDEKVKLTADVQRNKCAMLAMTLEMEGLKEELQAYRQLPTNVAQSQIDHDQLK